MPRPVPLTVLAGIFLLFGLYALGSGSYFFLTTLLHPQRDPSEPSPGSFVLFMSVLNAGWQIALGVGLLRLRPLARIFALGIFWLALAMTLVMAGWIFSSQPGYINITGGTYQTTAAESPWLALTLLLLFAGWAAWGLCTLMRQDLRRLFGVPSSGRQAPQRAK